MFSNLVHVASPSKKWPLNLMFCTLKHYLFHCVWVGGFGGSWSARFWPWFQPTGPPKLRIERNDEISLLKSHQPADREKSGFLTGTFFWFALSLFGKGGFFHIDLERSRNFSCVSNHTSQKNQGLKWLLLGFLSMWWNKPPNRPTALKRPRPKVSNRACGVLALVIERDIFFIDLSLHLFDPMVFVG